MQLEFELVYYDVIVKQVSHCITEIQYQQCNYDELASHAYENLFFSTHLLFIFCENVGWLADFKAQ